MRQPQRVQDLQNAVRRARHLIDVLGFARDTSRCTVDREPCGGGALPRLVCTQLTAKGHYSRARIALDPASGQADLSADTGPADRADAREEIDVPIKHGARTYGRLAVFLTKPVHAGSNEHALLSLIADEIGSALHNIERSRQERGLTEVTQNDEIFRDCFEGISVGMIFIQGHDRPLHVNCALADFLGYEKKELERASSTETLQQISHPEDFKAEMPLLHDLMTRRRTSYTMEKRFLRKDGGIVPGVITTTFFFDEEERFRFAVSSIQDISELARTRAELSRAHTGTIDALIAALESRDPFTVGHQRRVTQLACAIATEMGLDDNRRMGLQVASLLHDIGKIAIPAEILTKPRGVSEVEYSLIRAHPAVAHDILKGIPFPWPIADIVLQHHERLDGSGYPHGLREAEILPEARILAVADVVEALVSHRPYRPGIAIAEAMDHIRDNRSTLFDAEAVDACVRVFERGFEFEHEGAPPPDESIVD